MNHPYKALPSIISWGVWIARNSTILQYKLASLDLIASNGLGIIYFFPQEEGTTAIRFIYEEVVDRQHPWFFFRWSIIRWPYVPWGWGGVLYLSYSHSFKFKMGPGGGSNKFVELMDLKLLVLFALEKGCRSIQVYGDSMLMINWVKLFNAVTIWNWPHCYK